MRERGAPFESEDVGEPDTAVTGSAPSKDCLGVAADDVTPGARELGGTS